MTSQCLQGWLRRNKSIPPTEFKYRGNRKLFDHMFQYNEDSHKERGRNGNPGKKGPETREQQRKSQNESLHQG